MNLIDKISIALSDSLDYIIDKNRQRAQLNRIDAVIKNETDILNRAYIALGKQYHKMLEGKAQETDVSQICDTIKSAKLRLKKAKARYEYTLKYGVPTLKGHDDLSIAYIDEDDDNDDSQKVVEEVKECEKPVSETPVQEEEQDITIAVQSDSVEEKIENAAEALKEQADSVEAKIEAAAENLKPEE